MFACFFVVVDVLFVCFFVCVFFFLFVFVLFFFLYCFVLFVTFKGAMVGLWWCHHLELGLGPICQSFIVMVHSFCHGPVR